MNRSKANNEFEPFLNECQTYVWEWYIPEHKVRFGIPSLNGLWIDDKDKDIKLATMLERVHPDDVDKIFVRQSSPLYRSDKMFEVDLRLNVAAELKPDGKSSGEYEWYGFRGKTVRRSPDGRPVYLRGVAINIDRRVRVQKLLLEKKEHQLQEKRQQTESCLGVMQEFYTFLASLAGHAGSIISGGADESREEHLMRVNKLKEQGAHMMELIDRARQMVGTSYQNQEQHIQRIELWEHLAELQQVYSLKSSDRNRVYFSNLYDNVTIEVNVKLLDLLLENVVNCQMRNTQQGYLTIRYELPDPDTVRFGISCTECDVKSGDLDMVMTEGGMGLSFCRLLAKRLHGDIQVQQTQDGRLHYIITLPVHAGLYSDVDAYDEDADDTDDSERSDTETAGGPDRMQVSVLIGTSASSGLFHNQNLFRLQVASNTDDYWRLYRDTNPDIAFIDYNIPGQIQIDDLIAQMHQRYADTPIIVTAQYATRPLHRRVQHEGARYLLNNPLSLRKINMMIKKYLK